jgi:hypothetical protein
MMFNSPPGLSDAMDLAKMLACLDIIAPLASSPSPGRAARQGESPPSPRRGGGQGEGAPSPRRAARQGESPPSPPGGGGQGEGSRGERSQAEGFRIWRQTRTGLLSYPLDPDAARAHLAASVYLQMAVRPHILHVVGHTEAHHAATADDLIQACKLARRAVENALRGQPDMTADPAVQQRRRELVQEAQVTLEAIRALAGPGVPDPLTDPATLSRAVTSGALDAPHLRNNPFARGQIVTRIDARGACVVVDPATGQALPEEERLAHLGIHPGAQ